MAAPRGTVYLTGLQWELLWVARWRGRGRLRGQLTLTRLAEVTGSSRGRCWHALARLRSLDLVGFRAWPEMERDAARRPRRYSPGCRGRLLVWLPRGVKRSIRGGPVRVVRNDSVSTSFGGYLSREGLRRAFARSPERWLPPAAGGHGAGDGPRRGHPPRILWSRCLAGHRVHLQRRTWRVDRLAVTGVFEGPCRRCGEISRETVELRLPEVARALSEAERADPELFARRQAAAAAAIDSIAPGELTEQLRRDYLRPDLPRRPDRPSTAGELLERWRETLARTPEP